jgi:hypothetical protein
MKASAKSGDGSDVYRTTFYLSRTRREILLFRTSAGIGSPNKDSAQ